MPKRPQIVKNVTINKNNKTINKNTINNYFSAAPPTAIPVAEPAGPQRIFTTNAERCHKVRRRKDGKEVHVSFACSDGTLKGGCHNCTMNSFIDIDRFGPEEDSHTTAGHRQLFDSAYEDYKSAYKAGNKEDAIAKRAIIEEKRTAWCDSCREKKHLSPAQQACKDEWDRMRKEACFKNDGCQNKKCPERGMPSWIVLQADHGTNPKEYSLSKCQYWSGHGGVEAMREEAKQIQKWICGCCHKLESTGNSGKRYEDPETMPDGNCSGTKEEILQYHRKRKAKIIHPKQKYVDAKKREIGCCQYEGCGRKVEVGNEQSFDFDHIKEGKKIKGGVYGENGGVSGLVTNNTKAGTLDKLKGLLDREMNTDPAHQICLMTCHNCHIGRKQRGLGRWDVAE